MRIIKGFLIIGILGIALSFTIGVDSSLASVSNVALDKISHPWALWERRVRF